MKKEMTAEQKTRMQTKVREKINEGIEKAEKLYGLDVRLIIVEETIWDGEMETFLDVIEDFHDSDAYEVALSNSGTNFADIVIALTGRGWRNDHILTLEYGSKAVVFTR